MSFSSVAKEGWIGKIDLHLLTEPFLTFLPAYCVSSSQLRDASVSSTFQYPRQATLSEDEDAKVLLATFHQAQRRRKGEYPTRFMCHDCLGMG